jgi:hypothetical protein
MKQYSFLEFAVDKGYIDPVTVCSGIYPKDYVQDPVYDKYYKYLDDVDKNRSVVNKILSWFK